MWRRRVHYAGHVIKERASKQPTSKTLKNWAGTHGVQEKEQANNQTTPVESIRLTQVTNNKHSLRTPPNCLLGSPHAHTISVEGLSLWWLSSMHVVVVGVGGRVGWELRQGGAGGWVPTLLIQSTSTKIVEIKIILFNKMLTPPSGFLMRLVSHVLVMPRPACFIWPGTVPLHPLPQNSIWRSERGNKCLERVQHTAKQSDALPPPRTKHVNGQHLWYSTSCYWAMLGEQEKHAYSIHIFKKNDQDRGIDA